MMHDARTVFAQRRQLLRAALQAHIDDGRIPAQITDYIDALYARHRDFEAERIAGLALWLGRDNGTAWRETCFEGFGVILRAARTVLQGIATLAVHDASAEASATPAQRLRGCGLSPAIATRWCQLGRHRLPVTGATLPERGRRVEQLVQWLAGPTTLAECGLAQVSHDTPVVTSLDVVNQAAEDILQAIQTVSRCLWQVWVRRIWRAVAPRCAVFLDRELGIGPTLGAALIAVGHDSALWPVLLHPLARVEVVVTILARATSVTIDTLCDDEREPYA
jgi:hypothetical protein